MTFLKEVKRDEVEWIVKKYVFAEYQYILRYFCCLHKAWKEA